MRNPIAVVTLLLLTACTNSGGTVTAPGKELEAVRDFVVAVELEEVKMIRRWEQLKYLYVNDYFIILQTRRGDYLVEMKGRCSVLQSRNWTSDMIDIRVSTRILYADFDTIRGCGIGSIYILPEAQLEELRVLGDAPGNDVFVPQAK